MSTSSYPILNINCRTISLLTPIVVRETEQPILAKDGILYVFSQDVKRNYMLMYDPTSKKLINKVESTGFCLFDETVYVHCDIFLYKIEENELCKCQHKFVTKHFVGINDENLVANEATGGSFICSYKYGHFKKISETALGTIQLDNNFYIQVNLTDSDNTVHQILEDEIKSCGTFYQVKPECHLSDKKTFKRYLFDQENEEMYTFKSADFRSGTAIYEYNNKVAIFLLRNSFDEIIDSKSCDDDVFNPEIILEIDIGLLSIENVSIDNKVLYFTTNRTTRKVYFLNIPSKAKSARK